jgi:hypothetical protein
MMYRETASPVHIDYHLLDNLYRLSVGRKVARFCGWEPHQLLQVTLWDDLIITVRPPHARCAICRRADATGTGLSLNFLNPGAQDDRMICRDCLESLNRQMADAGIDR